MTAVLWVTTSGRATNMRTPSLVSALVRPSILARPFCSASSSLIDAGKSPPTANNAARTRSTQSGRSIPCAGSRSDRAASLPQQSGGSSRLGCLLILERARAAKRPRQAPLDRAPRRGAGAPPVRPGGNAKPAAPPARHAAVNTATAVLGMSMMKPAQTRSVGSLNGGGGRGRDDADCGAGSGDAGVDDCLSARPREWSRGQVRSSARCARAHGQIRVDEKVGVVIAMRVRTRSKARYIQRHFPAALVPDLQMSAFDVTKKNSAGAPLLSRQRARHGGRDRLEKL